MEVEQEKEKQNYELLCLQLEKGSVILLGSCVLVVLLLNGPINCLID